MAEEMEPLLVFEHEIDLHKRMFEASPLTIISIYLECFRPDGTQGRGVPKHVLEALAQRFLLVMNEETNSLDQAFGGKVARQRNRFRESEREGHVLWELMRAKEKIEVQAPEERGPGTAFEIAVERVAEKLGMSPDNVRRMYKKTGRR